jgi:prophage antirepressor-like protein
MSNQTTNQMKKGDNMNNQDKIEILSEINKFKEMLKEVIKYEQNNSLKEAVDIYGELLDATNKTESNFWESEVFGKVEVKLDEKGVPMFRATQVAEILEYKNPRKAIINHCKYVTKRDTPHPQSKDKTFEVSYIYEPDIYRLIFGASQQSKSKEVKEKAEKFKRWVFKEVLPSIRREGVYMTEKYRESYKNMIEELLESRRTIKQFNNIKNKALIASIMKGDMHI